MPQDIIINGKPVPHRRAKSLEGQDVDDEIEREEEALLQQLDMKESIERVLCDDETPKNLPLNDPDSIGEWW